MKTIGILGATGFIGSYLYSSLSERKADFLTVGTTRRSKNDQIFKYVDILDKAALDRFLFEIHPTYLVVLAGTKDVDFCEANPERAYNLNTRPMLWLLDIVKKYTLKTKIVFVSSDYVFDGQGCFYDELSVPRPRTVYGKTKFETEQLLLSQTFCDFKIVRTAAVQGKGARFYDYILSALDLGTKVEIFKNIYFTPTPITMFVEILYDILFEFNTTPDKIIHLVGEVRCTRYELVLMYANISKKSISKIMPTIFDLNSGLFQKDLSLKQSLFTRKHQKNTICDYLEKIIKREAC